MRGFAVVVGLLLLASIVHAQDETPRGLPAVASRYRAYAIEAAEAGRWEDSETILSGAADYADDASDLSYLLALARLKLGRPVGSALEAVRRGLLVSRWDLYSAEQARLLEAECLIRLRAFGEALRSLGGAGHSADADYLTLLALRGQSDLHGYSLLMDSALADHPRDTRFPALLFKEAAKGQPSAEELRLVDGALKRLYFLAETDPSLVLSAQAFIRDAEERKRLVASYRATPAPAALSIPIAIELGLLDEAEGIGELFSGTPLSLTLVRSTFSTLRTEESRTLFGRMANAFSGSILEDGDDDGWIESSAVYASGRLESYAHDADQDGISEFELVFSQGLPVKGSLVFTDPDYLGLGPSGLEADSARSVSLPSRPVEAGGPERLGLEWERYPYLGRAESESSVYYFGPASFPYSPVQLVPLYPGIPASTPRVPVPDFVSPRMTGRSLVSFAVALERRGCLTADSVERIEFSRGTPWKAVERSGGRIIAVTDYRNGVPGTRRLDLDADGRYETIQRYAAQDKSPELSETDLDGDGIFEYRERQLKDGRVERYWDHDSDGVWDRVETTEPAPGNGDDGIGGSGR